MVICFFKKQAEILSSLESFEIDMSFKRVRRSNMNEVVFATYSYEQNKGMKIQNRLRIHY